MFHHLLSNSNHILHQLPVLAAIDSNAYRHERSCHDLIILLLPSRLYASQGVSCYVKSTAVLHLTVDDCISHVYYTYSYKPTTIVWKKHTPYKTSRNDNVFIPTKWHRSNESIDIVDIITSLHPMYAIFFRFPSQV